MPKLNRRTTKPDTLLFADLHLHDRKEFSQVTNSGLNSRLEEGLNILDQIIEWLEPNGIRYLIFLGDVFELKDRVPNHILSEFKHRLEQILDKYIHVYFLVGNHDYNLLDYTTLDVFQDKIHLIDEPKLAMMDELLKYGVYFIPYQRKWEDFIQAWNNIPYDYWGSQLKAIFFHQTLPGGIYDNGTQTAPGTWQPSYHSNLLYVAGDLHIPQKVGKIQYLGSPYPTKFGTPDQNYYVWTLDRFTNAISPIQLNYAKFLDIPFDYVKDEKSITPLEGNFAYNNYLRITGEVDIEIWKTFDRQKCRKALEDLGAKAVTYNVTLLHPKQVRMEIANESDESIIEKYATEQAPKGMELQDVIDTGKDLWK